MDSKGIIAIVLSILVLVAYNIWYFKRYEKELEKPPEKQVTEKYQEPTEEENLNLTQKLEEPTPSLYPEYLTEQPPSKPAAVEPSLSTGQTPRQVSKTSIQIHTGLTNWVLTNQGGRIQDILLLKYHDDTGEPVNLVEPKMKEEGRLPVELHFPQKSFNRWINESLYEIQGNSEDIMLTEGYQKESVRFVLKSKSGIVIQKEYIFHYNSYDFDLNVLIQSPGIQTGGISYKLIWPGLGDEQGSWMVTWGYYGPTLIANGQWINEVPESKEEPIVFNGNIPWAGLQNRYYCSIFLTQGISEKVQTRLLDEKVFSMETELVSDGGMSPNHIRLYAGPKLYNVLKSYNLSMEQIINYGWFHILASPLYFVLQFLYKWTGNYGVGIILLTVMVKILFFPLSQKGFRSMKNMQKLQPKMKQIQELYKNDKQKLNEELMKLYRDNKVNPLGGCLPMVLQIPVFFALYKVLLESVELKEAYFIWWITDLSAKDPYYISPILMGISMYLQQKMTPSVGDPTQQKIMQLMPIIFTFMFLNFPSGLVIYWLANNILTIFQQYLIYKPFKKSTEEERT